jgi:hypothetical protein
MAAKVFNFLQENDVSDMAGLAGKVNKMYDRLHDAGEKLKKVERRLTTLDEHIRQSANFKKWPPAKCTLRKAVRVTPVTLTKYKTSCYIKCQKESADGWIFIPGVIMRFQNTFAVIQWNRYFCAVILMIY